MNTVAFDPSGRFIVTASWDGSACLWDVLSGEQVQCFTHGCAVECAAFHPKGKCIVTASSNAVDDGYADPKAHSVQVWDVETGKKLLVLQGHSKRIYSANFGPDGKIIVTASADETLRLWSVETGEEIFDPFTKHTRPILWAAFSPNGEKVVSASADNNVIVWDKITGEIIRFLEGHTDSVTLAVFSPDGRTILTASLDGTIRLWLCIKDLLELATARIQREPPIFTTEEQRGFGFLESSYWQAA